MKYDVCRLVFSCTYLLSGCNSDDAIVPVHNKDISQSQHASCCTYDKRGGDSKFPASTPPDSDGSTGSSDVKNEDHAFFDLYQGCQTCSGEDAAKGASISYKKFIRKPHHKRMAKKANEPHVHDCHSVEKERCYTKCQHPSRKYPDE
jgi:hypothetical protein